MVSTILDEWAKETGHARETLLKALLDAIWRGDLDGLHQEVPADGHGRTHRDNVIRDPDGRPAPGDDLQLDRATLKRVLRIGTCRHPDDVDRFSFEQLQKEPLTFYEDWWLLGYIERSSLDRRSFYNWCKTADIPLPAFWFDPHAATPAAEPVNTDAADPAAEPVSAGRATGEPQPHKRKPSVEKLKRWLLENADGSRTEQELREAAAKYFGAPIPDTTTPWREAWRQVPEHLKRGRGQRRSRPDA